MQILEQPFIGTRLINQLSLYPEFYTKLKRAILRQWLETSFYIEDELDEFYWEDYLDNHDELKGEFSDEVIDAFTLARKARLESVLDSKYYLPN